MTAWLWLQSIQITLLKCQPWLSPPCLSIHSRFRAGCVWLSGRVLVPKTDYWGPTHPSNCELLTLQESSSWSVAEPYSTDACAILLQGLQGRRKQWKLAPRKDSCHGKSIHSRGQHREEGVEPSLLHSELQQCSRQLPKQCFFRQYKEHTSNFPLSACQKVVSVNVVSSA